MSFPMGSQSQSPQSQSSPAASELCLRYPDNVGVHAQVSYEQAIGLLTQATDLSQRVPFAWSYIDKPPDGQAYLIFIVPSNPAPVPPDGIRWLDQEKTYRLPAPNGRELEVSEVKFGFAPGVETSAARVRRRFRLTKGGNPQLMLMHYLRGDPIPIPAHLLTVPVRAYPLRATSDPRVYVAGDRMGQRVPALHPQAQPNGGGVGGSMNMALGLGSQAAALAQQNQAMDALERERRGKGAGGVPAVGAGAGAARPAVDEDDSGDEYENVSTRSLAIERFKRNHELMAEVFTYASKGHRNPPAAHPSAYAALDIAEINAKVTKLTAEVEALKASAEKRRLAREAAETDAAAIAVDPVLAASVAS